jgi:hypothetical protein
VTYGTSRIRPAMLREGKVCFRTCFQRVLIPASYVIMLATKAYSTTNEPRSFREAFDHWLLCEILNAIGNHTIA